MTILKTVAEVQACESQKDLVETFNFLAGGNVTRFSSVEAGRRRVENAMLASKDADGMTGIPANTKPQVRGRKEIEAKAKAKNIEPPPSVDAEYEFKPGTLAHGLMQATKAMAPIPKRAKKEPSAPSKPRNAIYAVQATFAGISKPQAGSVRNNVLLHIQKAKNSAATIAELDSHFDADSRGYVNKLLEKNHLAILTEEEFKAAKPVAKA